MNLSNMRRMLALETAANDWFSKLSQHEQEAYKKAHPRSKYRKNDSDQPSHPMENSDGSESSRKRMNKHLTSMGVREMSHTGGEHVADNKSLKALHQHLHEHGYVPLKNRHDPKQMRFINPHGQSVHIHEDKFRRGMHSVTPRAGNHALAKHLRNTLEKRAGHGVSDAHAEEHKNATALSAHHNALRLKHVKLDNRYDDKGEQDKSEYHANLWHKHEKARDHFNAAANHYRDGNKEKGDERMRAGHAIAPSSKKSS